MHCFDPGADFVHVGASPPLYSLIDACAEEGGKPEIDKTCKSELIVVVMISQCSV